MGLDVVFVTNPEKSFVVFFFFLQMQQSILIASYILDYQI